LVHNDANRGANPIVVRVTDAFSRTATQTAQVHFVVGTVVRMETSLGFIDMELLDDDAPTFVDNFKNYFADYANSIVHRLTQVASDGLGVIQGGGFTVSGSSVSPIPADAAIDNNYNPANPNIRGSISMARPGGNDDGATSQWFINTVDNSVPLGPQTVPSPREGFTVFGHVIGSSLPIVDAIAALSEFDVRTLTGVTALGEVPLRNYTAFSVALVGTVATTNGSATVTGTGTSFTTAIPADKLIRIGGQTFEVDTVNSDTELVLTTNASTTGTGLAAQVNAVPNSTQYVTTSSVSEVAAYMSKSLPQ
jgi:cyclophilin family peptidyl-prolyl cis-trans isomerase